MSELNQKLEKLLQGYEDRFPHHLAERFPHIIKNIVEKWADTEAVHAYFKDLMIPKRQGRQGFPSDIAMEIFELSLAYDQVIALRPPDADCWDLNPQRAKEELLNIDLKFNSQHFFEALAGLNSHEVVLFLRAGMDIEKRDRRGWTPLMISSFEGSEDTVLKLLELGADPTAQDGKGYQPIHFAAYRNFTRALTTLIEKQVDPDVQSQAGITPVIQAAARGNNESVRILLQAGASANIATFDGWTPLHKAVANGHLPVVELLMAYNANPNAEHQTGVTPILIASEKGFKDITAVLLNTLSS